MVVLRTKLVDISRWLRLDSSHYYKALIQKIQNLDPISEHLASPPLPFKLIWYVLDISPWVFRGYSSNSPGSRDLRQGDPSILFRDRLSSQSLGWEDPLEKEMATHSSILAWKIPRTEKFGGLQSMGSHRVGHDWVTSLHLSSPVTTRP